MLSIEEITNKLVSKPGFLRKFLIGGVLTFIPLINILVLGYLYQFVAQVRFRKRLDLPEWERWDLLLVSGLRASVIVILFFLLIIVNS